MLVKRPLVIGDGYVLTGFKIALSYKELIEIWKSEYRNERKVLMIPIINKGETGVNLRRIMDIRGITAKDVQEYLGLGCVQSVYRWIDGINMPTIDNLYALSELFQVPIDAIVGGNRAPIVSTVAIEKLDTRDRRLYAYGEKLKELRVA